MDWIHQFPCLVPVWHSLSDQNLRLSSENKINPNLYPDIGGIGTLNGIHFKKYKHLPFQLDRPTLPFFLHEHEYDYSKASSYNCLAYCSKRKSLFSSKNGEINIFCLNENTNEGVNEHYFTNNKSTSINPFIYNIESVWSEKMFNENILDLRLYENGLELEILTYCRKSLAIYQYRSYEIEKLHPVIKDYNPIRFFPSPDSLLNRIDRNPFFNQQLITSFIKDSTIYRNDIEKLTLMIENELNIDVNEPKNNIINLEYLKNFNPFLYYYGTHENIWLGDIRVKMSGEKHQQKSLINSKEFIHFKPFELFQTFHGNPIDPHQFITTSDFNINFFDLRYPNKNLFQIKHMIPDKLVNRLLAIKMPTNQSCNDHLLMMASNYIQTNLFTFDWENIQPRMLHVPFQLNQPLSSNKLFPIMSENQSLIRGMQILPLNRSKDSDYCFSVAFLMNNGNIYLQDFVPKSSNESIELPDSIEDFMYENKIGDKIYLNENFDPITEAYMNEILKYLKNKEVKIPATMHESSEDEENEQEICSNCNEQCSERFCKCLRAQLQSGKSKLNSCDLNQEIMNNILSTENSSVIIDSKFKFRDDDPIDFEFIKSNWFRMQNNETKSIREYCRPLTQKLFDEWCKDNDESMNN